MSQTTDESRIRDLLKTVSEAHHHKDVAKVVAQYTDDAVVFDLAPPLSHIGMDRAALSAWMATWVGPIEHSTRDVRVTIDGDLAFCHGLVRVSATTPQGERAAWWMRLTACLRRIRGEWKIVHEHTSVPFHMDGSFRAATDLEP